MSHTKGAAVIASFHQTLWNINPVSSGNVRARNIGNGSVIYCILTVLL